MQGFEKATLNEVLPAPGPRDRELLVSSRRDALETLRRSVTVDREGPILLTGEPGAGKTWLWRRLVNELPAGWRWVSVEMTEALDALEFLTLINHGLGVSDGDRLSSARLALSRALRDEASNGRSWILVIENAQNTPEQVWNELLAIIHAMEATGDFASVILVGPTELARLMATRRHTALASRIATHAHLLPLDLQECRELVASWGGFRTLDQAVLEELHRDAAGIPRRIMQLCRKRASTIAPGLPPGTAIFPSLLPEISIQAAVATLDSTSGLALPAAHGREDLQSAPAPSDLVADLPESAVAVPLVPNRPPLRVEEGLIEVGWEGNLEAESTGPAQVEPMETVVSVAPKEGEPAGEELIEDHYAALQAWTEWATNRGRTSTPLAAEVRSSPILAPSPAPEVERTEKAVQPSDSRLLQGMRAESQHEHAPYSQLFSRLRQSS
jgi:general secretion pathway protein A